MQDALDVLSNPACASAIDGGTGVAEATLNYNLALAHKAGSPSESIAGLGYLEAQSIENMCRPILEISRPKP